MRRAILVSLLAIHAGLLAWQAHRYSPTIDEPAHLVAGISHWKFGRFDLYRVNPPLVRLVAALPMLVVDPKTDWSAFTEAPYARPEFSIGTAFANANGFDTFWHFTLARWACIPFSLIGGWYCYWWANELYGKGSGDEGKDSGFGIRDPGGVCRSPPRNGRQGESRSTTSSNPGGYTDAPGLMALILWCFCPNVVGNGTLITPDVAAASLGVAAGYYLWRWLRTPTWLNAVAAGLSLGLAELTKSSWIMLFALWPVLWMVWLFCRRKMESGDAGKDSVRARRDGIQDSGDAHAPRPNTEFAPLRSKRRAGRGAVGEDSRSFPGTPVLHIRSAAQLACALLLALYLLNLGYGFEQSFKRLGTIQFISKSLGGPEAHEKPGNRFAGSWLGALPVPFPVNYLRGIDVQKYDFETGKSSYLRGEQKMGGWWYYYLYAVWVKMPVGTLFLLALTFALKLSTISRYARATIHNRLDTRHRRVPADSTIAEQNKRAALSNDPKLACTSTPSAPDNPRSTIFSPCSSILHEFVLLAPAVVLITLVSSQSGFNRYLRYVVPAFPFFYIWISQLAGVALACKQPQKDKSSRYETLPPDEKPFRSGFL